MPQVPYSPIPTVTPSPNSGLPYQNASGATPDAFGANVGQAEQNLGRQVEQVGDMFAKHANVLQDRLNEADGNDLFVKWDIEKTQLMTQFQQLEGKNAKEALPKFLADQDALRQKYLEQSSNTEVRRIFDNNSKRQFGYMVGEAGRYTAGQLRGYENRTAEAVVQNEVKNAPAIQSADQLRDSIDRVKVAVRSNILSTHGGSEAEADEKALDATSKIIAQKTDAMSMTDPEAARQFYESHKEDVNGQTQLLIEKHLQQQDTNVGTRKVAHDILSGNVKGIEPLTENSENDWLQKAQNQAKKIAGEGRYADNPGFEDQLQSKIANGWNLMKRGKTELERGNLNSLREAINGSSDNPKIVSEDSIHTNPALEAIWTQLEKTNPAAIPQLRALISKNTKEDVPLTQGRVDNFNTIMGMKETDPAAFLMVVPKEKDLTFQQQNQVFAAQRKTSGQIESNSQFNKARTNPLVVEQLGSAQIFPSRTDADKTASYNQFMGAYKSELDQAAENNNGKYPNADEQGKIAAKLLRNIQHPGMFGLYGGPFGSDSPAYKVPDTTETVKSPSGQNVKVESRSDIIKTFTQRIGRPPQEQEIYQIHKAQLKNSGQSTVESELEAPTDSNSSDEGDK